jgi:hypothetical protein
MIRAAGEKEIAGASHNDGKRTSLGKGRGVALRGHRVETTATICKTFASSWCFS